MYFKTESRLTSQSRQSPGHKGSQGRPSQYHIEKTATTIETTSDFGRTQDPYYWARKETCWSVSSDK